MLDQETVVMTTYPTATTQTQIGLTAAAAAAGAELNGTASRDSTSHKEGK